MPDVRTPNRVRLALPTNWVEIDPREGDVLGEIRRQIDVPEGSEELVIELLAPVALRLSRLSAQADIVLAGFYSQLIDLEGEADPFVMTAQVSLAMSPPVGGLERLQEVLGGDGVEVRPVDLPAGPAVLVTGRTQVDDEGWT